MENKSFGNSDIGLFVGFAILVSLTLFGFAFLSKDLQSSREVPRGTSLFGEVNFETNPLTIPWKK